MNNYLARSRTLCSHSLFSTRILSGFILYRSYMCICPVVYVKCYFLEDIYHSSAYNLTILSSTKIPNPLEERCDKDNPFGAEHSKVTFSECCSVVGFCVNCHLLQEDTSLIYALIYGYNSIS